MNTFEPGRKCWYSKNQCVHSRPIGREAQPAFLFHTYCQKVDEMHVNVIEITINFTDTFVVLAILDIALCCPLFYWNGISVCGYTETRLQYRTI